MRAPGHHESRQPSPSSDVPGVQKKGWTEVSYTTDTVKQIWNDDTGEHIYVGPDGDGVDLVELRYVDDGGTICSRFTMTPEQAVATAKAILELYSGQATVYNTLDLEKRVAALEARLGND